MENRIFCSHCDDIITYHVEKNEAESMEIKGEKYTCLQLHAYCDVCGEEVYPKDVNDKNVAISHDAYRAEIGIITVAEMELLLDKYDIGRIPLSRLLGWGDATVDKQMSGSIPSKEKSETLKKLFDSDEMWKLLRQNGHQLTDIARRKVEKALACHDCEDVRVKIPNIVLHKLEQLANEGQSSLNDTLLYYLQCGMGVQQVQTKEIPFRVGVEDMDALQVFENPMNIEDMKRIWLSSEKVEWRSLRGVVNP